MARRVREVSARNPGAEVHPGQHNSLRPDLHPAIGIATAGEPRSPPGQQHLVLTEIAVEGALG